MRRPQGYAITVEPGKPDIEEDSITCSHCNSIVFLKPYEDPSKAGGFCRMCMRHVCEKCAGDAECVPFEKKMEAMERKDRLLRAVLGG